MRRCGSPHATTPEIAGCPGHAPKGKPARVVKDPDRELYDVLTATRARIATYEFMAHAGHHLATGHPTREGCCDQTYMIPWFHRARLVVINPFMSEKFG